MMPFFLVAGQHLSLSLSLSLLFRYIIQYKNSTHCFLFEAELFFFKVLCQQKFILLCKHDGLFVYIYFRCSHEYIDLYTEIPDSEPADLIHSPQLPLLQRWYEPLPLICNLKRIEFTLLKFRSISNWNGHTENNLQFQHRWTGETSGWHNDSYVSRCLPKGLVLRLQIIWQERSKDPGWIQRLWHFLRRASVCV